MPLLCSVVVTVYNKEAYILSTLKSVLDQSYTNLEIVVVDDGSTDASAEIIELIDDPHVRLHRQANAGVSAARNVGVTLARGDLIFFFDADDWMHPDYLRIQVEQAKRHPGIAFFAARFLRFKATLKKPENWPVLPSSVSTSVVADLPAAWITGQSFITSSVAIRRETLLLMQPCFPVGESKGEDLDLWFRVAEVGPLHLTEFPLVGYREATIGSLSTQYAQALFPVYLERLDKRACSGQLSATLARSTRRFVAEARTSEARALLVRGHRIAAIGCLVRASSAATRPRWWLTWLMALSFPGQLVSRWENIRVRETQARL